MSRLREQYENEIKDAMIKKFGYKNAMEIPKLDKIVVNMGVGEAKETIFMNCFSRSSLATGPKIRVPFGVLSSLIITAAFSSNLM